LSAPVSESLLAAFARVKKLLLIAVVAAATATAALAVRSGTQPVEARFRSLALAGTLGFRVFLPPGYDASGDRRYPVVYFLHGLPAAADGYRGMSFVADALGRADRPAILVTPQGARANEPDPEYLDRGPGRRWETAIAKELVAKVDAAYLTIPSRRGRALVGLSAGGYGAMLIGLHHLDRFSVIESWSGYFHPTDASGTRTLELETPLANTRASAHSYVSTLAARLRRQPTFVAFYVGSHDDRFVEENERLNQELSAAGVAHVFREYPGGHDSSLWQGHATGWLQLALHHLAQS
jgi:enterochelin esterase-like enzyme